MRCYVAVVIFFTVFLILNFKTRWRQFVMCAALYSCMLVLNELFHDRHRLDAHVKEALFMSTG